MADTTYGKQMTAQVTYYDANSPRTKTGKTKIKDQSEPMVKMLEDFDKIAGSADSLSGSKLKSAQTQAGDLLQQVMNQFGLLCETADLLKQGDANNLTKNAGPMALDTVSEKQAQANEAFDSAYLDKVSLVLMTFQANVAAIQGLGDATAD